MAAWCNEEVFRIFLRVGVKHEFPNNGRLLSLDAVRNGRIGLANYFWEGGTELIIHQGLDTGFSGPVPDMEDIYYQFAIKASEYPEMAALLSKSIDVDNIIKQKYLRPLRFVMEGVKAGSYENLVRWFLAVDWDGKYTTDQDAWLHHLSLCLAKDD